MVERQYAANLVLGIVIGTGPSLGDQIPVIKELQSQGARLFGVNNVFIDFDLDCWIACDPAWHKHYGKIDLPHTDQWHWDRDICEEFGYRYIEGVWGDGLSKDPNKIHLNHGSGPQILNLAVHYDCDPILLVGHDFSDSKTNRHYFTGLSDVDGEYPEPLRKWSKFDKGGKDYDMLQVYKKIADQGWPIINCTPGSKLPWFPFGGLEDYLD